MDTQAPKKEENSHDDTQNITPIATISKFERVLVNPAMTTPIDYTRGSHCVLCRMHSKGPCAKYILDVIDVMKAGGSSHQPEQMKKFALLMHCQRSNSKFYNFFIKVQPHAKAQQEVYDEKFGMIPPLQ